MKWLQKNHGQTLIEVLIAFATLAVIITSSTLAVIYALNNAQFVKNQHLALQYAQQGMEEVRSIRENDYTTFLKLGNPQNLVDPSSPSPRIYYYCLAKTCSSLSLTSDSQCGWVSAGTPCGGQNVDSFIRTVALDRTASVTNACFPGQAIPPTQVTVSVSWIDGLCPRGVYCHSSSVTSCLGPVNSVSTP